MFSGCSVLYFPILVKNSHSFKAFRGNTIDLTYSKASWLIQILHENDPRLLIEKSQSQRRSKAWEKKRRGNPDKTYGD